MNDPILSGLELQLKRNMLKWHAGQVMFCPACGRILDCQRAVELDIHDKTKGERADSLYKSYIRCVECWDKEESKVRELVTQSSRLRLEVTDGRGLFARPKRTTATRKVKRTC